MPKLKTGAAPQTLPEETRLKIVYRPTGDLTPYAGNARTHSDKQIAQIAASIRPASPTRCWSTSAAKSSPAMAVLRRRNSSAWRKCRPSR